MQFDMSRDLEWTPRQKQVLDMLARGLTNAQIADRLDISLNGAKWHVREVFHRLGVDSREEAAAYWREHQRLATRGVRALKSIVCATALRWTATAATTAALLGGGALVALTVSSDSNPTEPAQLADAAQASAPFTREQAEARALELAAQLANLSSVGDDGGPVRTDEFRVVSSDLVQAATSTRSNIEGYFQPLNAPTDTWQVDLEKRGCAERGGSNCGWFVALADGTGALLAGGEAGQMSVTVSRLNHTKATELARVTIDGMTFWLAFIEGTWPLEDDPAAQAFPPNSAIVCVNRSSSVMPGAAGGCNTRDQWFETQRAAGVVSLHGDIVLREHYRGGQQVFVGVQGLVGPEVATIRVTGNSGEVREFEPGPDLHRADFPWRAFIAMVRDPLWLETLEALDAQGNVIETWDNLGGFGLVRED